jgi:hypothetical protein
MGSGKTTWAIRYMNDHPKDKFIYITPFLSECDRVQEQCPSLRFRQPEPEPTKQASLRRLIRNRQNIVTTHSLLAGLHLDLVDKAMLARENYTFILDEALEVVNPIDTLNQSDIDILMDQFLAPKSEGDIFLRWTQPDNVPGRYEDIKTAVDAGTLASSQKKALLWILPIDLFQSMPNLIVMTFLFEASHLAQYFKVYHIPYELYHVDHGELIPNLADLSAAKQRISSLLNIYEGHYNEVGSTYNALSATDWKINAERRKAALINCRNFFRSACHANAPDCLYSGYKIDGENPIVRDYRSSFLVCNCKATNDFSNRHNLGYLPNIFENPAITKWFTKLGVDYNRDVASLSIIIQWIWRSAIRNGEAVNVFIPSSRMRRILTGWLHTP